MPTKPRTGQAPHFPITRAEFGERFQQKFYDPLVEKEKDAIARIEEEAEDRCGVADLERVVEGAPGDDVGDVEAREGELEVAVVFEPDLIEGRAARRLHRQPAGRGYQRLRPALVMQQARDAQAVATVVPQLVPAAVATDGTGAQGHEVAPSCTRWWSRSWSSDSSFRCGS